MTLEEDLPAQAARKSEFLTRELGRLQTRYPGVLKEIRGRGLLLGLEFPSDEIGYKFAAGLFRRGVLVAGTYSKARTVRIEPALGIPTEKISEVLNRIDDTLKEIAASLKVAQVTDALPV